MNFDKNKVLRIMTISIIFLSIMLAFQWYYSKSVKTKTLERALLELKYVDKVEITKQMEKVVIYLTLDNIDNLMEAYNSIGDSIKSQLKGQPFQLKIVNNNLYLEDVFNDKVQFIIYEALRTGEFTKMRDRLDELEKTVTENSASGPLKIQVFLDSNKLYLHMKLNESNYYKVIEQEV